MSEKFPQIKPKELVKALQKLGFELRRQSGSHAILKNAASGKITVVPMHTKSLKKGLVSAIMKQAEINKAELVKVL